MQYVTERASGGLVQHVTDLYLACACTSGTAAAIHAFEERYFADIALYLAHLRQPTVFLDEVKQRVREKLFVAEAGRAPKIADYTGRGALGGWLRLVATRTALTLLRSARADPVQARIDDDVDLPALGTEPELDLLRERHRDDFRAAFEAALAALPVADRNLLRLYYVDGLTIDDLAGLYRRHRSTVARQIEAARQHILQSVREHLAPRLGLAQREIDSLIAALRSQLDVSVLRFLKK